MGRFQDQSIAQKYFNRFGYREELISTKPSTKLGIIVVIPSFNEEGLIQSIQSLNECSSPECEVEVIVVLNNSETASEAIKSKHIEQYQALSSLEFGVSVYPVLEIDLPKKHAGVGLARKIGMDEAARRFSIVNRNGVIACFDADAVCDSNYLKVLEKEFLDREANGASIYFEHPLEGPNFPEECFQGILYYELFLRYYNLAQKYANLPFAFHTVGSSMAVKSNAYLLQGGMNKRKAGEDFYFLQKIIQTGNFVELNSTRVIPSPRTSDRVPFGTGKAISDWIDSDQKGYFTYDFEVFRLVKEFVKKIPVWYQERFSYEDIPLKIRPFFYDDQLEDKIKEIKNNTSSQSAFENRFFIYFDAFKMLKLVHWFRDEVKANQPLLEMVNVLNQEYLELDNFQNEKEALIQLRKIERKI